jgi:uncharacterized repeat protein (TIGR03803 family)
MAPARSRNTFTALLCWVLASLLIPAAHAQTATESTLHNFAGNTDGMNPATAVIQGGDGDLYGTTTGNLFTDFGGIFRISPAGTLTPLYHFAGGADSATPVGPVLLGGDGNLYGTTFGNLLAGTKGTVFKLTPAGTALTNLFTFTGNVDGSNPEAGLIQGSDGSFYGGTATGGSGYGTLFRVTPSGTLTTLTPFNRLNGNRPTSPPIEGSDGNFYGVAVFGGVSNFGTFYQLTPVGVLTALYNFKGAGDGASPQGPLVEGPDGNFYGATGGNGSVSAADGGKGTIFMITPAGVLTTLYVFTGSTDGASPSGLFLASDGNLYGDTLSGGANNQGTVFRVTRTGSFTTLYSFAATGDGHQPQAALLQASDGNFYGTATSGGTSQKGTVFKLALSPALAAPVQLTPSVGTLPLGSPVILSWQVLNAFSKTFQNCYGSVTPAVASAGAWAGRQAGTYDATTQIYSGSATITPTLPGTYTYGLTCGGVESGTATVAVGDALSLLITISSLPTAYVGIPYSASIGVSGGVQPYKFSITAGSLPDGLTLNTSTGLISGAPTQAAASNFTVQVQDSNSETVATASASFEMTVLVPLKITTVSLPDGRVGTSYLQTLAASGGTPPYTWRLSGAAVLPKGLSLSAAGVISGTPTAAGTTSFTMAAVDSASQVVSGTFSIAIDPLIVSTGTVTLSPAAIAIGQTAVVAVSIAAPAGSPAPTGSVQFQSNGVDLGSPVPVISGTASLTAGPFTATGHFAVTATYSGDPNYETESYSPATLAVTVEPPLAIDVEPASVSVGQGATASLTVTVLNFNNQSVALSCGDLPQNVSCSFTALSNAGDATLTLTTVTTAALHGPVYPTGSSSDTMSVFILPAVLTFAFVCRQGLLPTRRYVTILKRVLAVLASLLMILAVPACGGPDWKYAGTGTSTITVTAAAGNQTASAQITLTVR